MNIEDISAVSAPSAVSSRFFTALGASPKSMKDCGEWGILLMTSQAVESSQRSMKVMVVTMAAFWTLFMLMALVLNWRQLRIHAENLAREDARASYQKDLVYRRWATIQGGVYVPVTAQTPPNPYLANVPERDITTPSGRALTLMNPAYVTRQVHELGQEQYGTHGHITSLKPIRPENAPDAWETKALRAFEEGAAEVSSVEILDGRPFIRLMRPMRTEAGCLKCHAAQGYKESDLRGGISVCVPLGKYYRDVWAATLSGSTAYIAFWGLGLLGLVSCHKRVQRHSIELGRAEKEKERLEAQLRQAQKMEAIGTLAGGIAHDFNNILAAILGYSEMVWDDLPKGAATRDDMEEVLKAAHRAKDLVRQILVFSRQRDIQERRPIEINPIIKEALKLLRATLPSTIDFRQDSSGAAGWVMGDPTQIHQVMVNLCTNAAHAMRKDGGVLEVTLTDVVLNTDECGSYGNVEPGAYVKLAVRDTGEGMDSTTLERIFDPYFTTKEVGEGSGLGLAVLHGIVKRHQGAIAVESQPGKGTVFHVLFPRIENGHDTEDDDPAQVPGGSERILFVDDEEVLAAMAERMLTQLGYRATARVSSLEAMELFRENPDAFDIVITDYTMPQMTGVELARQMLLIRPEIPIVLCTGFNEMVTEEKARETGIRVFALKPLSRRSIAVLIRQILDEGRPGGE